MSNVFDWQPHAKKTTHRLPPPFGVTTAWVAQMRLAPKDGKARVDHLCSGRPHQHKSEALAEAREFIASLGPIKR